MSDTIACPCGYSGPAELEGLKPVCPLCGQSAQVAEVKRWRIPCPNGHVFKASEEWMGKPLVCPKCNEPFVPRICDSLEEKEKQRRRQEQAEQKLAKTWLNRAIAAAVLFVALIVGLIAMSLR